MNKRFYTVAVVVILLAVVWFYWRKAVAASNLSFSLGLPRNFALRDASVYFTLPIRVLNANPESITISGLNLQAGYNANYLGTAYALKSQTIAALGETTVYADWFIPIVNLINIFPELKNASKSVKINFKGQVRAFGLGFPVDYTQIITLPQL
ncbi:LEA type 2 family protein [Runella sp.]|uniref:LEA type 2 family protein n=1 Tax=Runella sp. TaxID=1960881 RepID=UPI003D142D88